MNNRHAYLIIAHTDFELLGKLISALDDERNDIYLHIDKKSQGFNENLLIKYADRSKLFFIKRKRIYWGHYSIVECEMRLLEAALKNGPYKYYHLISGQDFPIRNQDYIHEAFDNSELEYITSWKNNTSVEDARNYTEMYKYYYFMQKPLNKYRFKFGHPVAKAIKKIENISLRLQKKMGVDRSRRCSFVIYKGDQWFSITDDFARYVVDLRKEIRRYLKYTYAPDELLIATLAENSEFRCRIAYDNFRLIDWTRGTPYTFSDNDYDEIVTSGKLFVRKVSNEKSSILVGRLIDEYMKS